MNTSFAPPSRKMLTACVRSATTAPSLHNSQPWLFRISVPHIDVYADPSRQLPVVDPDGREMLISVGAAVFTLRAAVRGAGYDTRCELLPDADQPDLAARVTAARALAVDPPAEALAAAIPYRHTNRWPFAQVPVPADQLGRLRDAARREGAVLTTADPAGRDAVLGLARHADRWLRDQPDYRAELDSWTDRRRRHDGVPVWSAGPWDALEVMPVRDFATRPPRRPVVEPFEPYPTIMVLATAADTRLDWLRAGQALQRVLLTATWLGLATMPISQPIEAPAVREALAARTPGMAPQLVLRVGYGRVQAAGGSPRRPLSEVLLRAADGPRPAGPTVLPFPSPST
ncbi:nitroreductase [Actinoplanes octamycinicus]|uniref:Nitroreductase n=1 Tax=Actinoplanes octamycinicus TaxID=135948 RepID=A0A7W7H2I6_9ACTN|nr:nitroreductase family protein [Actinoplanes octamycinicus]MBB4742765.1 nitroreductase [Actinoplanes octamycinicus]GIE58380.1 NAD(P)H nitroreductase [Actinoplanes octamycinicus]